jgi:hypothetical protein
LTQSLLLVAVVVQLVIQRVQQVDLAAVAVDLVFQVAHLHQHRVAQETHPLPALLRVVLVEMVLTQAGVVAGRVLLEVLFHPQHLPLAQTEDLETYQQYRAHLQHELVVVGVLGKLLEALAEQVEVGQEEIMGMVFLELPTQVVVEVVVLMVVDRQAEQAALVLSSSDTQPLLIEQNFLMLQAHGSAL